MSEDQIRAELSEIRAIQRESHYEIIGKVEQFRDEIINSVREYNKELREETDKKQRQHTASFRWMVALLFVPLLGLFSWFALGSLDTKDEQKELKADFGSHLLSTYDPQILGADKLLNKYYPTRGNPAK